MAAEERTEGNEREALIKGIMPHAYRVAMALRVCGATLDRFHGFDAEEGLEGQHTQSVDVTSEYLQCVSAYAELLSLADSDTLSSVVNGFVTSQDFNRIVRVHKGLTRRDRSSESA